MRAVRFQEVISRSMRRRKFKSVAKSGSAERSKLDSVESREADLTQPEPLKVQQQLLDDETRALQVIKVIANGWYIYFFHYGQPCH